MLRRWLVVPACIAGLALVTSCSSNTAGQASAGDTDATLSATSWGDLSLGDTPDSIRAAHSDFPAVDGGTPVSWQDADLIFDADTLISIAPRSGGRTDSGLTVNSSLDEARAAHGEPVSLLANVDGTATAIFLASAEHASGFRVELATPTGPISAIALCNCLPGGGSPSSGAGSGDAGTTTSSTSAQPSTSSRSSGPEEIVIRPVDARGGAAPGFTVDSQSTSSNTIECSYSGGIPADAAVDDDIFKCSPNAAGAHTCWASPDSGQALCLQSAFESTLVLRNTEAPLGSLSAPGEPIPLGLELEDGSQCMLRNGGAWPFHPSDPNLNGRYGCDSKIIWSATADPFDKSSGDWTVVAGASDGPLRTLKVIKAYYVGTA